jgi:signal transduction histidine kinase
MIEFTGAEPDQSRYLHEMEQQAAAQRLDYLEVLRADGTVLSSAQWANFNRKEPWTVSQPDWSTAPRFLLRQELVDERPLAVVAVKAIKVRGVTFLITGGRKLDAAFLDSLGLEPGMRARLFLVDPQGFTPSADPPLAPLLERVRNNIAANVASAPNLSEVIAWTSDHADDERAQAIPLSGLKNDLLGVLVIGNSMRDQVELARSIRWTTIAVGCIGLLFGILMSSWLSRRVTKPVEELARAAGRVAHGEWKTHVAATSNDELGQLAEAFNKMTEQLIAQREQLVQTERVAAWRELARRLAHELKNPLFPLQITVENLLRARQSSPEMFDEIFRESTETLLAEIANLKAITGRFSDFSKMPAPQKQAFNLNEMVRAVEKLFSVQFTHEGAAKIVPHMELTAGLPEVSADPVLIRRAIENLVLNALDAMPQGGTLTFRTSQTETHVGFELADSGEGLTPEECERLFTPYYTSKQHGTGLGLAIVQSVISDHGGRVSVQSEKGSGTTFVIELPKEAS